jgi:hypothetical protein
MRDQKEDACKARRSTCNASPYAQSRVFHAAHRIMRWLVLHEDGGEKQILTMDKRQLIQTFNLDLPTRDMRLMDSQLSNYETLGQISVRENTIVFSMEHVQALIMANKVIVPLEDDKSEVKDRFTGQLEQILQVSGDPRVRQFPPPFSPFPAWLGLPRVYEKLPLDPAEDPPAEA